MTIITRQQPSFKIQLSFNNYIYKQPSIFFNKKLLFTNNSLLCSDSFSSKREQFLYKVYTIEQLNFHDYIDEISYILNQSVLNIPQLSRSQDRDVHKLITCIGVFMNSSNKNCIFKNNNINTEDTLKKLNILKLELLKYCFIKHSNNKPINDHYEELKLYLQTTINYIKKKKK